MESSKPRKQRKFHYTKKLHAKQKALSGHLSKKLREELKQRSLPIRKDDRVKIMRGSNKGKEGKVIAVNCKKGFVSIEKLTRKKADGTEIPLPIRASNIMLLEIYRDDDRRIKRKQMRKEKAESRETAKKDAKASAKKGDY